MPELPEQTLDWWLTARLVLHNFGKPVKDWTPEEQELARLYRNLLLAWEKWKKDGVGP